MKTRILSVMLLLAMLLTSLASVVSAATVEATHPFTDVPKWATAVVNKIYADNIMKGTGDTTFNSNGTLTRQELATTLYRMSGSTDTATADELKATFTDGDKIAKWALDAVKWAYDNKVTTGIADGDKIKFDPKAPVTKEQAATFIMRFIDFMKIDAPSDSKAELKDLDKVSKFAKEAVSRSIAAGIITGDNQGYFKPKAQTKRIEAAAMLARIPEASKGIVLRDLKIPSQDPDDPNPESLGTSAPGAVTFLEDIKISKAVMITDGTANNQFSATGMGVHGWHESRVVRSEYGTYVVFAQDERKGDKYEAYSSGYNKEIIGKFFLVKITDDGFKKVLEGEYPVHAGSCAPNVLAGEDGMIYVTTFSDDKDSYYGSLDRNSNPPFTCEAAYLTVYEYDTKTDTLVSSAHEVLPFDLIGVHGYGYYQPILDVENGKLYALFTGGEVPGYLSWFIYDLETHTWEKENYLVETKHRNSYFNAYPDGRGGIFFVSQANPPSWAVEEAYNNEIKFASNGYLFHAINLYHIPNMYEEKVELKDAIYDPDYTNRRKFPEIARTKEGASLIESASAAHYTGGTTYLASNGYLYVIYEYTDPSSTGYVYAIYDTMNDFELVRTKALSLMLTTKDKIGTANYEFSISESMDGDIYLTAINTKPKAATFEIYKLDIEATKINVPMIVDADGKAASVTIQMKGSTAYAKHDRLSYTSSRNGSIQDNILGVISYDGKETSAKRNTTLQAEGFDAEDYSTVNWSGGLSTYELYYYAIEFPND